MLQATVALLQTDPGPDAAANLAGALALFAGSFDERSDDPTKTWNTSTVFDPDGRLAATYRKLHLFDLDMGERGRVRGALATMVPSNFTVPTGRDHWEPLLRARAIENGQYLIAAATISNAGGEGGFVAYGRSLVVDPWGTIIACAPDEVGITYARIDTERVTRVRRQIPALQHLRPDVYGTSGTAG